MRYEVVLPSLGDDDDAVTGGVVSQWIAKEGGLLQQDDDLIELTTDKAAFVVPCPVAGALIARYVEEGAPVKVGDLLGVLEV